MSFPKSRYIRIYVMGYGCNHILSYKKVGSDMSYVALYRKWRPDTFDEVKGQDHIVTTLRNQIKNDRLGHAFLFCGTRGTGKTSIAKIFAKACNCEHPVDGSPCNECASCRAIADGSSLNVIEIDAASNNGVDNIRQIREEVAYPPTEGKYKVYIIDEVHMLSPGAFNALLKTLEEPPSYVIFILATTESHKIPITISSRCQKYDFRRIPVDVIADRLADLMDREGLEADRKAIDYVAKSGDGSMRDALSILDQCVAFNLGQKLTYDKVLETIGAVDIDTFARLLECVLREDVEGAIDVVDEIVWQGRELGRFVSEFTWFLRNILVVKLSQTEGDRLDMTKENLERIRGIAVGMDESTVIRYINVFSDASASIKYSTQKRIVLEMAVIKLCRPQMETDVTSIVERVRFLEEKLDALQANGIQMQPVKQSSSAGEKPAGTDVDPDAIRAFQERLSKELPQAEYEDLQRAADNWNEILGKLSSPARRYLGRNDDDPGSRAKLILADDRKKLVLMIPLTDDELPKLYFEKAENVAHVKSVIEEYLGKSVEFEIVCTRNSHKDNTKLEQENILNIINFKVERKQE